MVSQSRGNLRCLTILKVNQEKDRIARMENSIADYLTKLDEADAQAASQRETVQLKSKLA